MGFFDFLFGRDNKKKSQAEPYVTFSTSDDIDYYSPKYFKILESRPNIFEIYGRDYNFPKYNDKFITSEGYSLRELLLLVWWVKTKSGRKSTVSIPKYFFSDYNLNAEKLTRKFKLDGLIFDEGERTLLTEEGRKIADKYLPLWEIHSIKQYPTNLDIDFPKWDKNNFDLMIYQMEIRYYSDHAKFCKKLVDYFNSLNAPESAQKIYDEINYYINEGNSDLAKIADYKEKVTILKEKINETKQLKGE